MANVIAHRGANASAPQNTIASFKRAVLLGCDGFENDVHLTKDGVVVVCHNYTIDETSNGKGYIKDMTFEQLRSYDFGSYFGEQYAGEKIPTLEEFLDVAQAVRIINIEVKNPPDGNMELVSKTLAQVKNAGLEDRLIISSFSDDVLKEVKRLNADIPTGLLYDPMSDKIEEIFEDPFGFALNIGCSAIHPVFLYCEDDYIEQAHNNGLIVNAWTCNTERVINALLDAGCDGLITDVPDLASKIIAERE